MNPLSFAGCAKRIARSHSIALRLTGLALITIAGLGSARAAKFTLSKSFDAITIQGEIIEGDEDKLRSALVTVQSSRRNPTKNLEIYLASPGGQTSVAYNMAVQLRAAGVTTRVGYQDHCASACVVLFAGGVRRIAHQTAVLAVHSVGSYKKGRIGDTGEENVGTFADTTRMGRVLAALGTPPVIIGKMVATAHQRIAVLTPSDLAAWKVEISTAVPSGENWPVTPPAPPPVSQQSELIVPSESVMRILRSFGPVSWDEKVAYLRGKGSTFHKDCSTPTCRFVADYSGDWAQMTLYVEEITRVGQIPTKVWCVSDIKAPVRFCYSQDTGRGWVQRYDPTGEAWKTVSARLNP